MTVLLELVGLLIGVGVTLVLLLESDARNLEDLGKLNWREKRRNRGI